MVNVAVDALCDLLKGKTVEEAAGLTEGRFYQPGGSQVDKLRGKVLELLELLNKGLTSYHAQTGTPDSISKDGE